MLVARLELLDAGSVFALDRVDRFLNHNFGITRPRRDPDRFDPREPLVFDLMNSINQERSLARSPTRRTPLALRS